MHDPLTVAFEIRYPWKRYGRKGRNDFERNYREPLITIWHKDPEKSRGCICRRSDDTCGWSTPSIPQEQYEAAKKLGREQYSQIFERQYREAEKADFASVCYVPFCYDAIYWSWRAIKFRDKKGWRYGDRHTALTPSELQRIYELESNPIDNLRHSFEGVKDCDSFVKFFINVYFAYIRFHRPWYQHPRWHIHHWRIQFHPWQQLRRRFWDKCSKCGKRGFKPEHGGACGNWSGTEIWHSTCEGQAPARTHGQGN